MTNTNNRGISINPWGTPTPKLGLDYGPNITSGEPDYEEMLRKRLAKKAYDDYMSSSAKGLLGSAYDPVKEQSKPTGIATPLPKQYGTFISQNEINNANYRPAYSPLTDDQKKFIPLSAGAGNKLASGMDSMANPFSGPSSSAKVAEQQRNEKLSEAKLRVYKAKKQSLNDTGNQATRFRQKRKLAKAQLDLERLQDLGN